MNQQIGVKAIIERGDAILLMRRGKGYHGLSDGWDIPGGRIKFGEEPLSGLEREIHEETGLKLKKVEEILDTSTVYRDKNCHIVRITYRCSVEAGEIVLSGEHTEYKWVLKRDLLKGEYKDQLLKRTLEKYSKN